MTTAPTEHKRRVGSLEVLLISLIALAISAGAMSAFVAGSPDLSTAATVFCGVFVQALPFLVLGVVVSGLIAAFVSAERLSRWLPRSPALAVAVAGVGGAALPGCECGSVPVARRLFGPGTSGAAALTFMLSAPAINPVVLVATAVAFPGEPAMVLARCLASLATAVVMGLLWSRFGRDEWVTRDLPEPPAEGSSRWTVFTEAARHDFLQAASYLVVGAAAAAALHVLVPAWVYGHLAGNLVISVPVMAVLAVVLALCSEADAFVAASMTMLRLVPRLVFLVVGPAFDVKLSAMQAGMFGRRFAVRFGPATFVVATVIATIVGLAILGGGR
ncbi:permease [Mycobacterium sp. URHB0044]|uniref:permease n=1 Tax=Mycobacterium sp. URHB0044 TaxID=1380386 RepID=UPI000490A7DF|nr:permease [Mycobacterium sp. URHB0044]